MRQNRMGGQMKRKSETCVDLRPLASPARAYGSSFCQHYRSFSISLAGTSYFLTGMESVIYCFIHVGSVYLAQARLLYSYGLSFTSTSYSQVTSTC